MIPFKLSLHQNGLIQKWKTNKDKILFIRESLYVEKFWKDN